MNEERYALLQSKYVAEREKSAILNQKLAKKEQEMEALSDITYDIEENLRKEIAKLKGWLRYLWDNWELPWQREGMPLNDTETEIESYIKVMDK